MVVYCTVCKNNTSKNKDISYFSYPKEPNRRCKWLKAVDREDLVAKIIDDKARMIYRICEAHFEVSYIKYAKNRSRKYLHDHAFPTLNLPPKGGACSSQCEIIPKQEPISLTEQCLSEIVPKQEPISPTEQRPNSNILSIEFVVEEDETTRTMQTEQKMQCIESKVAQTAFQLPSATPRKRKLSQGLRSAKKHKICDLETVSKDQLLKLSDKFLTKGMSQMIKWQIDAMTGGSGNKYSQAFKYFALNLHYSGPAAYIYLKNALCLPSVVTLQKLVKPTGTKLDERLLRALKTKVDKMGFQEKICSVCVDCIPLKTNLFYDVRNDKIIGLHEINGIQKKIAANNVIVIMIRGIVHNWKQPIAYAFLSQSENDSAVNDWIDEILILLFNIGLDIRVFISNLGSKFLNASKSCSISGDKTFFEINGHKIYYMFNVPHLLKCLCSTLMTCDCIFDNKIAKWSHIMKLYFEDKKRTIKLAPNLKDIHVDPNNIQKMSAKQAAQVLSRNVASAIHTYVDLNLIDAAARDTADFVNSINNLFDLLNSSTLRNPYEYKSAFRGTDDQIKYLEGMQTFLQNLKLVKSEGHKEIANNMNFIHGFQISIKSLLQLYEDLKLEKIKFLYTRRLNLNCLETFFGKVRQASGNCVDPTCRQFSIAFKKIFVNNILKISQNTNCDLDFDSALLKADCQMCDSSSQVSPSDVITVLELTVGTIDYQFDLPEQNGLVYLSGYLYKKCLEYHMCDKMKMFSHYKDFNESRVKSGFYAIPPNNFVAFVESLEKKIREYFDRDHHIVNIGNEILQRLEECKFDTPCDCFPIDYLKRLYVRFRIYHSVKKHNKLLKTKNYANKIFKESSL